MTEKEKLGQTGTGTANGGTSTSVTPGTRVYCGPSIKGVARQYTVYTGKLPDALETFVKEHKAAGALIVPVSKFAETRKKLETPGTAQAILYKKIKSEL